MQMKFYSHTGFEILFALHPHAYTQYKVKLPWKVNDCHIEVTNVLYILVTKVKENSTDRIPDAMKTRRPHQEEI